MTRWRAERVHFKVVVPSYNSAAWLPRTLRSIAAQSHRDYEVVVVDDASTDPAQVQIITQWCARPGWRGLQRSENVGALANLVWALSEVAPTDDDVVFVVDGDDWLAHRHVLRNLARIYAREPVTVTWGQHVTWPHGERGCAQPLPPGVLDAGTLRQAEWIFSAPRTFRYGLWKHLADADLRGLDGAYFRAAWDVAFMLPLVEMAGHSARYVHQILYVYNVANPLSDWRVHLDEQCAVGALVRSKPPYARRVFERCRSDGTTPRTEAAMRRALASFRAQRLAARAWARAQRALR